MNRIFTNPGHLEKIISTPQVLAGHGILCFYSRTGFNEFKSNNMGKIAIIGSGFVGQATGITLAEHGQDVEFIDISREKVADLKSRGYEAFLPDEATGQIDVFFLTVPSPSSMDGSVDLS